MSVSWVARLSMQLESIDCSRIHISDFFCISLSSETPLVIISFHDFVAYPPSEKSKTYLRDLHGTESAPIQTSKPYQRVYLLCKDSIFWQH